MATRELFFNSEISRRGFLGLGAAATASVLLAGCSSGESTSSSTDASTSTASEVETSTIKWAKANSGNVFVTLATEKGYFAEYGLTVEENPVDSTSDALTSLANGKVDVTSNNGTNNPLQFIAKGNDFTIVGGYMLKGMYIVAKKETEYKDVTSLVGSKFAGPASQTAITGALLNAGHDPINEVEWLTYSTNTDRLSAVVAGEADYAVLSGDLLYNVGQMDDIKIVAWLDDLTPNYGCCRMNMRTDFVNDNPKTMKALMKSLLKAECWFTQNKEESVTILAEAIGASEDKVKSYLLNDNYVPSVDPVKNSVIETWNVMVETGFIDEEAAKSVNVEDHINTTYYKEALDELLAESSGSDKSFYEERETFFKENNE